jgi:hypothetical protein
MLRNGMSASYLLLITYFINSKVVAKGDPMVRLKNPDNMTAEEEIRSVLDWARRTGHVNIATALSRALAKWPASAARINKR